MTKKELYDIGVEKAVEILAQEIDGITTYDTLKDFAKDQIDEDNFYFVEHILGSLDETHYYYKYDYSMGTLETPTPITSVEDLEEFCED